MNKWLNQYLTFIHILFNLHGYGTPSTSTPDILRTYRNPSGFLPSFLRWFYRSYKHSLSIIKPLSVIPHGSGTLQTWSGHSRTNDQQRDLDGHVTPVRSTKIFRRLNRDSRVLFPLSLDTCIARDLINDITMSCSISLLNNATWLVPTSDIPCDQITSCVAIGYNFSEWALEYLPVTWTDKSRSWHILPLRFPPSTWTHLYNHCITKWRLMLSKHSRETVIDIASRSKE